MTIPESVIHIGSYAFSGSGLTEVTIPESVIGIGAYAFWGCESLKTINFNAVRCGSLPSDGVFPIALEKLNIGNKVEIIPSRLCYSNMSRLTELKIPESVTAIGDYAFNGCSGLTEVTIPKSVKRIGTSAFSCCNLLEIVNFNAVDCETNSKVLFPSTVNRVNFGNKVEKIPSRLCFNMINLTELTIPESVMDIGDSAFEGCCGLTEVTIPESVTDIGDSAFEGCNSLEIVNFNAVNCETSLKVVFPITVKTVNIGNKIEEIPAYLCNGMTDLTEITIGNSVISIGVNVLYGCNSLKIVNFNAVNCNDFTSDTTPFPNSIRIINIGNNVRKIPAYFCYENDGLTEVIIPDSVTSIGREAFHFCSSLKFIVNSDSKWTTPLLSEPISLTAGVNSSWNFRIYDDYGFEKIVE